MSHLLVPPDVGEAEEAGVDAGAAGHIRLHDVDVLGDPGASLQGLHLHLRQPCIVQINSYEMVSNGKMW